jgi:dihydrofolate synthase/folylpolyglutamate synthase
MKNLSTHKQSTSTGVVTGTHYSYHELVEYLDGCWIDERKNSSLSCMKKLDKAFGAISKKIDAILITGTNGKSLTTCFTARLLQQEGLSVGAFYSPHLLTYNERFTHNNEMISNKQFTDIGNEVVSAAETLGLKPHALDILTTMAFLYYSQQQANVALLELTDLHGADPVLICKPQISAITRITGFGAQANVEHMIKNVLSVVSSNTHVVSADQSKLNLNVMEKITVEKKGIWAMPIRKLAPLVYPFEQLHGRSAALAERIAQLYMNIFQTNDTVVIANSLLVKQKGQRGRPTLEAKRQAELHPQRTMEQFWKDISSSLPGRFQLLDKEKPTVLLDTASNGDAMENLLLGIRLLHYRRPIKGLVLILANTNARLHIPEFVKQLRYFFKKMSGSVIVCPASQKAGPHGGASWDQEKVANDLKSMKIKARSAKSFQEALDVASKIVDERNGLIVVAGSSSIVTDYWHNKGMKRL